MAYIGITKVRCVATPSPRVIAQPLHGIAEDGSCEAALMVLDGVVHVFLSR